MRYVLNASEMKRADENTIEKIGISGAVLMERAALALLRAIQGIDKKLHPVKNALIAVGVGNNGGDGLALARLLLDSGVCVDVLIIGDENKATPQWREERKILESVRQNIKSGLDASDKEKYGNINILKCDENALLALKEKRYDLIADAIFGVGLKRDVEGLYEKLIECLNLMQGTKLSVDIPSGVSADDGSIKNCAFKADMTVTFGFLKRGLLMYPGCLCTGEVIAADVGINEYAFCGDFPEMFMLDGEIREIMPYRRPDGHKGTFGKVLLIAGSKNMAGAAVLSARAVLQSGAGMVKVLSCEENRVIMQTAVPEAMFGTYDELEAALKWADVIAIGCGIQKGDEAGKILYDAINKSRLPIVIDADGLNILSSDEEIFEALSEEGKRGRGIILTPHIAELKRLVKYNDDFKTDNELIAAAGALSRELNAVVVAKNARSYVVKDKEPVCISVRGNNAAATAGSGDVLAGCVAGIFAQIIGGADIRGGSFSYLAACIGVNVHGEAVKRASLIKGDYAVTAKDIAENIGVVQENNYENKA
ncbi:MAG: NAD(P)H-hydrate dehydratase [Lachnospiraceae bacterium]|nr:NAD(P)H-hydrate dehydratase [Lachnospiraceae bacterium]